MRERFKQWQSKNRINKWWVMGAIATPVFFWMVGGSLLPDRSLQPDYDRLSPSERIALADQQRETLIGGIGAIATVVGGVFLFRKSPTANRNTETANLSHANLIGADLNCAEFSGADLSGADLIDANLCGANLISTDLSGANLSGANLSGANLSGADLSSTNLSGADLSSTNLSGANLNCAELRYANLSGADLRYANLSGADLRQANLSGADLNCALLVDANFSDANLSGALLFFINSRDVQNLEPLQLEAKHSPFLCNAALPAYASRPDVNPNRDCDRIPQLLSDRYDISLEEAQEIVYEARQHHWD
ncbi:pentapeptide repeat-containing protein [Nodosilinea sp. LEGE 07298]|uniref:pentapeptide repeat-containing protein n=1 Tax=Nodosilinea sp. LEGE 07298 TaxID=2777970 RepID=UPI0018807FF4|nr:pentapeptide repeat-containing protein [Nodosilinea sp. LEGE 07298]MBE9114041.1 pentapeptide repeat-containing protein [Nodosilinea sp. LEGE 07298]